jgi:NTE family protein
LGASSDFEQVRGSLGVPLTWDVNTLLLQGEVGYSSDDLSPERSYSLGGFLDVSGYEQSSLVADNYWVSRTMLFRRIAEGGSSLFQFGGYVGGTFEYASLRSEIPGIGDSPGIIAGSIFVGADTPLLPIYLGFGMSDESEKSVYLAVGRISGRRR